MKKSKGKAAYIFTQVDDKPTKLRIHVRIMQMTMMMLMLMKVAELMMRITMTMTTKMTDWMNARLTTLQCSQLYPLPRRWRWLRCCCCYSQVRYKDGFCTELGWAEMCFTPASNACKYKRLTEYGRCVQMVATGARVCVRLDGWLTGCLDRRWEIQQNSKKGITFRKFNCSRAHTHIHALMTRCCEVFFAYVWW